MQFQLLTIPAHIIAFTILQALLMQCISAASVRQSLHRDDSMNAYAVQPNEVLPIQPLLVYPDTRRLQTLQPHAPKDKQIIYVKLMRRPQYRPQHQQNAIESGDKDAAASKEHNMKDIIFVKALANGKFSQQRLKVYQLPEFYAINVFHKAAHKTKKFPTRI